MSASVRAAVLCAPFWFVGPGSNFATVLDLADRDTKDVVAGGEDVMEATRLGYLDCGPKSGGPIIETVGYEDMPDIEITHRYWRTAAGNWLVSESKAGDGR